MRERGATLVEMLVVVVMIGIMSSIALPGYARMQRRWQVESAAQQLVADLHRARVEALKRNDNVFLAKSGANTYTIRFLGTRTLPNGASFATGAPDTVRFAAFGPAVSGAATYKVDIGSYSKEVFVNAAGFAAVK